MNATKLVKAILELRTQFGPLHTRSKLTLLGRLARVRLDDPESIQQLHECLLFQSAYPDSPEMLPRIDAVFRRIEQSATRLDDSGIAGSTSTLLLSFDAMAWLVARWPRDVAIDWDDGSAGDGLDDTLPLLMSPVERDGFLTDQLTTQRWLRLAARHGQSELSALLALLEKANISPEVRDRLLDAAELHIRWRLRRRSASRTWTRFPPRPLHFHREPLQRGTGVAELLAAPAPIARRLTAAATTKLLDIVRAVLYVRNRETDPITYADRRAVALYQLERSIDVALFGLRPDRRLALESFVGFVLAKNRVPIGYGGAWVWFDRAEIGVNVFDSFRGGESAFAFAQVMRVYRWRFGLRRFLVDPFQFGADNDEGIQSGAFWFYYRLGFRPIDRKLRALAQRETARMAADLAHRTPPRILKRLAAAKLSLDADGSAGKSDDTPNLHHLGQAMTRRFARRGRPGEAGLESLFSQLENVSRWPVADRRALAEIVRAKRGPDELRYMKLMRSRPRLRAALATLARP